MRKIFIASFLLVGCSNVQTTPSQPTSVVNESKSTTPVSLAAETKQNKIDYKKVISKSSGHKCYLETYKSRGKAPKQLVEGLIANFTQEICSPSGASSPVLGNPRNDALAYYRSPAKAENLYALMIGSGMQESSGGHDCGQDSSAPENRTGPKAEAGIFQTSYDSITKSDELKKIYEEAKAGEVECHSDLYMACTGANKIKNWGTGEGVNFQALTKSCQGFAAKYHSIMLRVDRSHYGPVNRKNAEMMPSCTDMFSGLKDYILANKDICGTQ